MLSHRPPVVVILGHVDHGKTTLLDALRRTDIVSKEAGGITQHIRSFVLNRPGASPITFIDTPGHEAFSQMRQRGSRAADIALLVVAADDGVMPQTKQSLSFIRETGIPLIVVINKIDLPTADPDRVKNQLAEAEVIVEDFGGQVPCLSVSAKSGQGLPELLEMIDLLAGLNPPQSDSETDLELVVLESRLDSKKGPLAVVLVRQGTLSVGQSLYQADRIGKAKAVTDSNGGILLQAPPSSPVEILGLTIVPPVGSIITSSSSMHANPAAGPRSPVGKSGKINFIIRTDVAGSLEAILNMLDPEAGVISAATGEVNENDVSLARTSKAEILAFNVRVPSGVSKLAETEKVQIASFNIIYELFKHVDELLHPLVITQIVGKAIVIADFKIDSDRIAGCRCTEGNFDRTCQIQIQRQGRLMGTTRIKSLHQGKKTIEKVKTGMEFGAIFSPYIDFKPGDDIIATIG